MASEQPTQLISMNQPPEHIGINAPDHVIAKLCHEANRAICMASGDFSQKPWREADQWQRDSAINGVRFRKANPEATPEQQHEAWCQDKYAAGWVWGSVKNAEEKTHPCLLPYSQLPFEQRVKDHVFGAIVGAFLN